jgi:hypothetical protein
MRIMSKGDSLIAFPYNGQGRIEWHKGSHYAHILTNTGETEDLFSFAWEKNRTSMLDFTQALHSFLVYSEV